MEKKTDQKRSVIFVNTLENVNILLKQTKLLLGFPIGIQLRGIVPNCAEFTARNCRK